MPERVRSNARRAAATVGEAADEKDLKSVGLLDLQALRLLRPFSGSAILGDGRRSREGVRVFPCDAGQYEADR
ncbi:MULTISPECIES: hypothetical protein [unclassified Bradyrhizobium]|uniref:hypothetical protein n=1 Tax=unclassified Bradyrhizobium TaxID=2631580 RepID=UPI0029160F67|nr:MULTISPECIES: hypothetical protein [unclassified Bradyrhizobium]